MNQEFSASIPFKREKYLHFQYANGNAQTHSSHRPKYTGKMAKKRRRKAMRDRNGKKGSKIVVKRKYIHLKLYESD